MRSVSWHRETEARSVAADVWRYLTDAVIPEDRLQLEAAKLLGASGRDFMALARVQFLLSDEVRELLDTMPRLIRRLSTTTVLEREASAERVRGAIRWGETVSERLATGLPHLYVTSPARRAYQTPENELLVSALDSVQSAARKTGWHRSTAGGIGSTIRGIGGEADRWLQARALTEVARRPITPMVRSRILAGRAARRYRPAVDVFDLHARYLRRKDRTAVRDAIEQHALLVAGDDKLLELKVLFELEQAFRAMGFEFGHAGLVSGGKVFQGAIGARSITVYFQKTPTELSGRSRYVAIQRAHGFARPGGMIPDLVLEVRDTRDAIPRWIMVEVKGVESKVDQHARRAIRDLLAYRRAFDRALKDQPGTYGLAVAWGANVVPSGASEIAVCSPDTIEDALAELLSSGAEA